MSIQNTFEENLPIAFPGQLSDMSPNEKGSFIALTDIPFGRATTLIPASDPDNGARLPDGAGQFTIGVSIRTLDRTNVSQFPNPFGVYLETEIASILREGVIFVIPHENVVIGQDVYYVISGTELQRGTFYGTADATRQLWDRAKWDSTTNVGEIGKIRIS